MTRTLDVHPSAQAEAEAAGRYYAERNPRAAGAFVDELDDAMAQIELAPHAFLQHVHGTRRLLLRTFPFAVVYRFDDDTVLIVAVAHGSRRPGYWALQIARWDAAWLTPVYKALHPTVALACARLPAGESCHVGQTDR